MGKEQILEGIYKAQKGFKFPKDRINKTQEDINKRDKRKKFVKSDYPTYKRNRVINKRQEGGELPTFALPNVDVYPNNRWGDIARKQGLKRARNWKAVKEGTTKGINDFINSPQAQGVLALAPLPSGLESVGNIGKLFSRAKRTPKVKPVEEVSHIAGTRYKATEQSYYNKAQNLRQAIENVSTGNKDALNFVEHPLVRKSQQHNTEWFKRAYPNKKIEKVAGPDKNKFLETKIYPDKKFEEVVSELKTNTPSSNIKKTNAVARRSGETLFRDNASKSTAFHEFLHQYNYGEDTPARYKAKYLFDKDRIQNLTERQKKYFLSSSESAVQFAQLGKDWGVKIGEPYPGDDAFWKLVREKRVYGSPFFGNSKTLKDRKRFWSALNGTFFTGTGLVGANNVIEKKQEGGQVKRQPTTVEETQEKVWLENWLNSRKDILKQNFRDTDPPGKKLFESSNSHINRYTDRYLDIGKDRLRKVPVYNLHNKEGVEEHNRYVDTIYPHDPNQEPNWKEGRSKNDWLNEYRKISPQLNMGTYFPAQHYITINEQYPEDRSSTRIHEYTHAFHPQGLFGSNSPQLKLIRRNGIINNDTKVSNYYDDSEEIYSRLMQLRFDADRYLNHKPNKVYTEDDLNSTEFKFLLNKHRIDRYTPESILYFLNNIADNSSNQGIPTAKQGGKLNPIEEFKTRKLQQGGTINGYNTYDYSLDPNVFSSWNSVRPVNYPTYEEKLTAINLPTYIATDYLIESVDDRVNGEEKTDPVANTITENFKQEVGKSLGTVVIDDGVNVGNQTISGFIDLAKQHGLNFRVTSGYREGAMTTNGVQSWHARNGGNAIDIVPINQTFEQLKDDIQNNEELLNYLRSNGLGILEETNDEILKKTGGTGYHFHIGGDQSALNNLRSYAPIYVRNAVRFITGWEGFSQTPYTDTISGKTTIGHGLTDPDLIKKYMSGISNEESIASVNDHINKEILPYFTKQSYWSKINNNLKSALIDSVYGLGITGFNRSKKLISLLNADEIDEDKIIQEMNWNQNSKDGRRERTKARQLLASGQYNFDSIPYSNNYL